MVTTTDVLQLMIGSSMLILTLLIVVIKIIEHQKKVDHPADLVS